MNAEQAIEELKNGAEITYANSDTEIFYKMCHDDVVMIHNKI